MWDIRVWQIHAQTLRLCFFLLPKLPKLPSQCNSNGPGNLGNGYQYINTSNVHDIVVEDIATYEISMI